MTSRRRRLRGFFERQDAVSPIIGSILILVIMTLAIGGILSWGVPAVRGLQDYAEYQTVLTQFLQLDSEVRNLRDPQNTRISTLSFNQGSLDFNTGDRWVVSGAVDSDYNAFYLSGWEGSNPASVTISGIVINPAIHEITVDKVTGATFKTVSACFPVCTSTASLGTAPNNVLLNTDVARVQVKENTVVVAEAWIMHVGRLTYKQYAGSENNIIHFEMGAVLTQQASSFYLEQGPTIKDPDYTITPDDTSYFHRMLQLTGTASSVGGKGRFPVVFNLVDNYGAARGRPSFDPATMARIQIHGLLEAPFCNYLDDRTNWVYEGGGAECPTDGTAGNVNVRYNPGADPLVYDLNHAVVTTTVKTT